MEIQLTNAPLILFCAALFCAGFGVMVYYIAKAIKLLKE